jgi:hypothetical protein
MGTFSKRTELFRSAQEGNDASPRDPFTNMVDQAKLDTLVFRTHLGFEAVFEDPSEWDPRPKQISFVELRPSGMSTEDLQTAVATLKQQQADIAQRNADAVAQARADSLEARASELAQAQEAVDAMKPYATNPWLVKALEAAEKGRAKLSKPMTKFNQKLVATTVRGGSSIQTCLDALERELRQRMAGKAALRAEALAVLKEAGISLN